MRGGLRPLVNPPISSHDYDARTIGRAAEDVAIPLTAQELIGEHQGTGYPAVLADFEPVVIRLNQDEVQAVIQVLRITGALPRCFDLRDDCVVDIVVSK